MIPPLSFHSQAFSKKPRDQAPLCLFPPLSAFVPLWPCGDGRMISARPNRLLYSACAPHIGHLVVLFSMRPICSTPVTRRGNDNGVRLLFLVRSGTEQSLVEPELVPPGLNISGLITGIDLHGNLYGDARAKVSRCFMKRPCILSRISGIQAFYS